ncbi:hypothetical protein [Rothia dentocariosa]|nr:hypothetical protein [Rothia dentocariosa]
MASLSMAYESSGPQVTLFIQEWVLDSALTCELSEQVDKPMP